MQEIFGLTSTPLGGAAGATDLSDMLKAGALAGAPVPEPATWIMMVAGFGAAGYGLRRRRDRLALRFA